MVHSTSDNGNVSDDKQAVSAFAKLLAAADTAGRDALIARAKLTAMNAAPDEAFEKALPESFDFDADPPEPDWIVVGLLERGTVNTLSGDTGSAKSIHAQDLAVRLTAGDGLWMNREIKSKASVLYLDEENPERIAHSRLKALGMDNASKAGLRYFRRQGIQLASDTGNAWVQWLGMELGEHQPDVVIIDTAMAVLSAEVNNNDDIVAAFKTVLRPIAERHKLAVLILHHERKTLAGEKRSASQAMMGGRQWAGQSDVHVSLTPDGEYSDGELDGEDGYWTRKDFRFAIEKMRDGGSSKPELTTVKGTKRPFIDSDGEERYRLAAMNIEWGGVIERETAQGTYLDSALAAMQREPDRRWTRKDVARACGVGNPAQPDGSFIRAWNALKGDGYAEGNNAGVQLTDKGREYAVATGLEL